MTDIYFSEEHEMFRTSLQKFLEKEVKPHVDKWEESGSIDRFIWNRFGEMGYFGLPYPEAYGGHELDLFYTVILLEELQKVNSGGFAAAIWAHTYLAMTHLNAEGNHHIKQEYLAPSITGEKIGCLAVSEPFGGSDVAGMRSTAARHGETYILNGSKTFITNGYYCDYMVVAAKTSPESGNKGISMFVVDKNSKGVSVSKLDKLGWRASDTAEIAFDNCEVPAENLLGEEGKGFPYIMQHFALERLLMAINAHARADFALEYAKQYMSERKTFGKHLNEYQALRHKYAERYAEMDMCKIYNYNVAYKLNKGDYPVKEATIAKLTSTKMADEVIYDCLQWLGGYGYMEEYPMARLFRDSRLGPIGGGTSEILREIISKMVIDGKVYKPATQKK
ncbi:MAG: acyl-CoA dehydrogenase [Flavobacteriaceae bacterium]|nr:acyl-CoA dehydrogenase family protein [Bacteroidia bacterium]NNF82665.1 acyl-CoA dehydrogenase [Flavobacteriaceae bacterium]NNK70869.1 acyl-CoA dehydrogenase [Flavobacteriaceae bacterium]